MNHMGKFQIWVKNFDEKIFFIKIFLFSLFQCEHVSHEVETVKDFHKHISGNNRHPKDSTNTRDFFKTTWKMSNFGQKIDWKKNFHQIFLLLFIPSPMCFGSPRDRKSLHSRIPNFIEWHFRWHMIVDFRILTNVENSVKSRSKGSMKKFSSNILCSLS